MVCFVYMLLLLLPAGFSIGRLSNRHQDPSGLRHRTAAVRLLWGAFSGRIQLTGYFGSCYDFLWVGSP